MLLGGPRQVGAPPAQLLLHRAGAAALAGAGQPGLAAVAVLRARTGRADRAAERVALAARRLVPGTVAGAVLAVAAVNLARPELAVAGSALGVPPGPVLAGAVLSRAVLARLVLPVAALAVALGLRTVFSGGLGRASTGRPAATPRSRAACRRPRARPGRPATRRRRRASRGRRGPARAGLCRSARRGCSSARPAPAAAPPACWRRSRGRSARRRAPPATGRGRLR